METNEILNNLKSTGYITIADPNENIKKLAELGESTPLEPGDAENSLVQAGSNAVAFGVNSTAFGTSSTNAKDRGITEESTPEAIIEEWARSTPEDDKFALTLGEASHIEGNNCLALGKNSHAEGNGTLAGNNSSHAEGTGSVASGKYAHAEGLETTAEGNRSHVEGWGTRALSEEAHAEGHESEARTRASHAEGYSTITSREGYSSNTLVPHSQGTGTSTWVNACSHAEGNATIAQGLGAHAEGEKTFANGPRAHAEGLETVADGPYASHAEGEATHASGEDSHAEGWRTKAKEQFSHSEGVDTSAEAKASHVEGFGGRAYDARAIGAHVEGIHGYKVELNRTGSKTFTNQSTEVTIKVGDLDVISNGEVTEVNGTTIKFSKDIFTSGTQTRILTFSDASDNEQSGAFNRSAHAEGTGTCAKGDSSHTEGYFTKVDTATDGRPTTGAHAEGYKTFAGEWASHSEGYNCQVNGSASSNTLVPDTDGYEGQMAHAEGNSTLAKGNSSHTEGVKTFTQNEGEHAEGRYNKSNTSGKYNHNTISSIGIGTADNDRKNAFEVLDNGLIFIYGVNGYDGTNIDITSTGNSLQAGILNDSLTVDKSLFGWE